MSIQYDYATDKKARKQHTCYYCGGVIEVGEVYRNQRCTPWDGLNNSFDDLHIHIHCDQFAGDEGLYDWDDGVDSDGFMTTVRDCCDFAGIDFDEAFDKIKTKPYGCLVDLLGIYKGGECDV